MINHKILLIIALNLSIGIGSSFAAYNALDLSVGESVAFAYNGDMDQRRLGWGAYGIWNFSDNNSLVLPALRYNLIPVDDRAFLDSVHFDLTGFYSRLRDEEEFGNATVIAVGVGGGVRFKLLDEYSFLRTPLFLNSGINYAPAGSTYRDGNNLLGWFTRLEYPIFGRSLAFLGFRQFITDLETDDGFEKKNAKIDQTLFLGIHFVF